MAVGGEAIAGDFGVDLGAARLGALIFLQHQHAGAAGDDETVAVAVIGARGGRGRVVKEEDIAPMASNSTDRVQSRSSQPPANITSCLPYWIISAALPMQWVDVAQAEEME